MPSRRIAVVGLGYVGLPVAAAFGRLGRVVALDRDPGRVDALRRGLDRTGALTPDALAQADLDLTTDPAALRDADFIIVTVPTPVDAARRPNLEPIVSASSAVGANLSRGAIVVYESTVYPGVTEEVCVPILQDASGLRCGPDFAVGYSPERINPGDRERTLETITKIVSGSDARTLDVICEVYGAVVKAGLHRAPSIKVAEAAKVIENVQRDLNIALVNELSLIFHRIGIDTNDVLAAAGTKWNFLRFSPGLVGGHCIDVDPYYLTHLAEAKGYYPEVILAGRRVNERIAPFVAQAVVKHLLGRRDGGLRVTVLGLTFKEDVPDVRNTRVVDVVRELTAFGAAVQVHDPVADAEQAARDHGIALTPREALEPADAVVLAVPHKVFRAGGWPFVTGLLRSGRGFVADVKGMLDRSETPDGVTLWRL